MGKTQVALKYASVSRQRYPGGIFWLSARSESTIIADLSRICEALGLNDGSSLASKFKRWLSSRETKNYLLIFDSADDPEFVPLSSYVPNTSWGHIVYTSRDQGIVGTLAKTGVLLNQLALEEAILVLLQKADVLNPSAEDLEYAQQIVEQFSCLPLAIDQAGAYIKARHKSLSAFKKLCTQRLSDILRFKPRLAECDQTVFTIWEMNFEQVEKSSTDARKLLLLFCYLDAANIQEATLDRACSLRKRWSQDGEIIEIAPSTSGVDNEVIAIVQDEMRFDDAIEVLGSFSLIYFSEDEHTGLRKFSIHPMVQYCASQRVAPEVQSYWRAQSIALICHAFPRDEILEPLWVASNTSHSSALILQSYFSAGIIQMPHARRVLHESRLLLKSVAGCSTSRSDIAELYLSSSRFGDTTWKLEAVAQAKKLSLEVGDPYLCVLVASRESSILRMRGETLKSNEVLQVAMSKYIRKDETQRVAFGDLGYHAQAGKLIQSRAENLIFVDDLEEAQRVLNEWSPSNDASPSSMEKIVQVSINLTLGRLSKIQGDFEKALSQLTPTLEWIEAEEIEAGGWRRVLLASIGEVYCELERSADAQFILISELDSMKLTRSQNMSSGLRLQLVLAESYLRAGSHDRSREIANTVKRVLERSKEHSSITRRFYLRAWTILARIAHTREHWDEALDCWKKSLKILHLMHDSSGPSAAVIEFSIAYALHKQGRVNESAEREALARDYLKSEKARRYHFTGLDSYWRDTTISELSQWTDPMVAPTHYTPPVDDLEALKV